MICSDWYDPLAGMNQFSVSELLLLQLNTARPPASTAVLNGPFSLRAPRPARAAELSDPWPVASANRKLGLGNHRKRMDKVKGPPRCKRHPNFIHKLILFKSLSKGFLWKIFLTWSKKYLGPTIHCSQRFSWPIYSQSTALCQRLKQIVNWCLESRNFTLNFHKNLGSRNFNKNYNSIRIILHQFSLKSDFKTVK